LSTEGVYSRDMGRGNSREGGGGGGERSRGGPGSLVRASGADAAGGAPEAGPVTRRAARAEAEPGKDGEAAGAGAGADADSYAQAGGARVRFARA